MRIHYLQHVAFEGPASIRDWASARGHEFRGTLVPERGLPPLEVFDMLVVMGGPMGVHDEGAHPWLGAEKELLRAAIDDGKRVLGVCLGGQLVAHALGARVVRNGEPEIGWFPVRRTKAAATTRVLSRLPEEFEAFHWHADAFGIPPAARRAAGSVACANQAFEVAGGRVLALQFHLETERTGVEALIENLGADLPESAYVQTPQKMLDVPERFERANQLMSSVLDAFAEEA